MKPAHPVIKVVTFTIFLVLMSGFVAFKSGAFESPAPGQLPPFGASKIIQHKYQKQVTKEISRLRPPAADFGEIDYMIASSKVLILAESWRPSLPWFNQGHPDRGGITPAKQKEMFLMSGSKSTFVYGGPETSQLFKGIFSGVPLMKVDRPVLKQGNK